jgi:transcriptional regulator with XRE-family HTH domain
VYSGSVSKLSNAEVARRLGITASGVSRLRSGNRRPSFDLMVKIANEFWWPLEDQARSRDAGNWVVRFETHLTEEK